MEKQLIWVFEWRKSVHYWWSYILFSPGCKELTSMLDPLLYRWGVPPVVIRCVHWTMQMGVLLTLIMAQSTDIVMLIEDQSWIDCIDITSRWDTFVLYHLYGNKGVSLPLWPIRPRWFHTFCPCAEPLGDGYEGMWARFGSQGSIALNWHSRYSGTRYSGTWLYNV